MARRRYPGRSDDDPTEADIERFGGVTRTCPECKTEVYDDSEICWKCGHAFGRAGKTGPVAWVLTAVIIVVVIAMALTQIF